MDITQQKEYHHEMILVPAGEFLMGALPDDEGADFRERPRHKVHITTSFYVGKYLVTQSLWELVMEDNPSYYRGGNRPVEMVSWFDCIQFCNKLSALEGKDPVYTITGENVTCNWSAKGYRLLTEAEHEYCARANQNTAYSGSDNLEEVAWYDKNSNNETQPVGVKKPNGFGLYDMTGNVFEFCWDWYGEYPAETQIDPKGSQHGEYRVSRGGSWIYDPWGQRLSLRFMYRLRDSNVDLGFRLAMNA